MSRRENADLVVYRRVSTKEQGRSGLGLEAQESCINAYIERTGCRIVGDFTEIETGKIDARPELERAKRLAKRKKATLVIAKLDRLSRDVHFISGLIKDKVDFFAVDCPNDDVTMIHFRAVIAEDEARKISQRTKAALAAAKARGVVLGTPANLTSEAQTKGASVNRGKAVTAYAPIIPLVEKLRGRGLSMRAIAKELEARGHTTRTGCPWSAMQVKRILDRSAALGALDR